MLMSSGIYLFGREFPTTSAKAWSNFKQNAWSSWKVIRSFSSSVLGVSGVILASHCYECQETNNTTSVSSSTGLFNFDNLSTTAKVCFIGGGIYLICGAVKTTVAIVKKGIISGVINRVVRRKDGKKQAIYFKKSKLEVCADFLPELMAGVGGCVFGIVLVGASSGTPAFKNQLLNNLTGGVSAALYCIDASLALAELSCLNEEEKEEESGSEGAGSILTAGSIEEPVL